MMHVLNRFSSMPFASGAKDNDTLESKEAVRGYSGERKSAKEWKRMRMSAMKGIAAGSLLGLTVGAGLMMTPQGKRMKRVIAKGGPQLARQVADCWTK